MQDKLSLKVTFYSKMKKPIKCNRTVDHLIKNEKQNLNDMMNLKKNFDIYFLFYQKITIKQKPEYFISIMRKLIRIF